MIVMINGSFGVGKSTVARLLQKKLAGSVVYDPELIGSVLMRLPSWFKLTGSGTDDFQDIRLWRRLTVGGIRLFKRRAAGPVIVPMTFTRRDYLGEVVDRVRIYDDDVRIFCLAASLVTIRERLAKRGDPGEGPAARWTERRIKECAAAHEDPYFGETVDTETRTAPDVAKYVVDHLKDLQPSTALHTDF